MHNKELIDQIYKQALNDAQGLIHSKSKNEIPPPENSTIPVIGTMDKKNISTNPVVSKITKKWDNRTSNSNNLTKLHSVSPTTTIVVNRCYTKDIPQLNQFDIRYSILGDHQSIEPSRNCSYICDINDGKYVTSSNTLLYFGALTGKTKICQKKWTSGDIRSFKNIDTSIYKNYFDPLNGMIPSVIGASLLYCKQHHPTRGLALYGVDIHDLPVVDQRIINDVNVILCE